MAIAPNESMTSFYPDRASGWGSDVKGRTWNTWTAGPTATIKTAGGVGEFFVPQLYGQQYACLDVPDASHYEVLSLSEHNSSSLVTHGPMIAMSTPTKGYAARMTNQRFSIVAADGAATITEMNGVDIAQKANTRYWMRIKYDQPSGQIRAKFWEYGKVEPTAWTITSYVGSYPITGKVGYYAMGMSVNYTVKVHALYVFSPNDSDKTTWPINDAFATLYGNGGWGRTGQGHIWRGHVNYDPALYAQVNGSTASIATAALATISSTGGVDRFAWLGAEQKDTTFKTRFRFGTGTTNPIMFIGLRAKFGVKNGSLTWSGYEARLQANDAVVRIYKRTTLGGAATLLGSANLGFTIATNTFYNIRLTTVGTNIAVKVWGGSASEPTASQVLVNDSSIKVAGSPYVRFNANGAASNTIQLSTVNAETTTVVPTDMKTPPAQGAPAPVLESNRASLHSFSVSSVSDKNAKFTATYIGDNNANASVLFQYRLKGSSPWTTYFVPDAQLTRTTQPRKAEVTFSNKFLPASDYEARVQLSDAEGVEGSSARIVTFTTLGLGVKPLELEFETAETTATIRLPYLLDTNNSSVAHCSVYRTDTQQKVIDNAVMPVGRKQKVFELDIAGLRPDTEYNAVVTLTDSQGVHGLNPISATKVTLGKGMELLAASVAPTVTSAGVSITYRYDTNENSSVKLQYRSVREQLWTTVNASKIVAHRADKMFTTTISGLSANMVYELRVIASDPDGFGGSSPTILTRRFSTQGIRGDATKRGKQHLYRIYNPEGAFLGTWNNAPEPHFSLFENGGVTNLGVTLPLTLAEINIDRTIDFMNRVDVWCVDGDAGMGKNLLKDPTFQKGSWVVPAPWVVANGAGPSGGWGMYLNTSPTTAIVHSERIELPYVVPLVVSATARSRGGKLRLDIEAFDTLNNPIGVSPDNAETVGIDWQTIKVEWLPPPNTSYVRVRIQNVGRSAQNISQVEVLTKEQLIYRGTIESYQPTIDSRGERVTVEVLGLSSFLSDDYIDFMQWVEVQPVKDAQAKRPKKLPTDPANMMKDVIDQARKQNPRFPIYYTSESIQLTGENLSYTIRSKLLRDCLDDIRDICPPNWHWFIDPTGCLFLRGPQHVATHNLRLGIEVLEFSNDRSIRNIKNHVVFKGRQDEDGSELDGHGSINAEAFNQESIDKYGIRTLKLTDANVTDPTTATMIAEGRLEEHSIVEESGQAKILDEKDTRLSRTALRGYNVQALQVGDLVQIRDPKHGPNRSYWDQFKWDVDVWDSTISRVVPQAVPIKAIHYKGTYVDVELSQRLPSANGDFAAMAGAMRRKAARSSSS